ncbi:MAG: restriction endonuclease subunit S [Bacteroidetes bacterium 4572_114]|nr:MAG: restriction endonuclease subunit S [Bacteroidetes bacterium 4572_114]
MTKLQAYPKYKPVDYDYVKELPVGWQLLPNIAIFQERIERGFIDEELLSVTIGKGVIRQADVDIKKDSSNEDKSKYKLIKVGDIAYNKMRMWQGALGYSQHKGISSPAYVILNPKMKINPKYFHYMFRTGFYTNYSKRFSYGIVDDQLSLRYTHFKRMYSIVPPLETQNAVVDYLDRKTKKIQEFISKKERLVELLEEEMDDIINYTITNGLNRDCELVTSKYEWIGNHPKHWSIKRLRFIGSCQNGISAAGDKFGKGLPFVSYSDVYKNSSLPTDVEGLINSNKKERENYSVKRGDVFFTRTSETIEEIGFASTCLTTIENAVFAGFLIRVRPKKDILIPEYSEYYFRSIIHRAYFVKEVDLVTRVSLGQDLLKSLPVLIPPNDEQKQKFNYASSNR